MEALRTASGVSDIHTVSSQMLGAFLGANRVYHASTSEAGEPALLASVYHDSAVGLADRSRPGDLGPAVLGALRAGQTVVVDATEPAGVEPEGAAGRAQVVVPQVEAGHLVGLLAVQQVGPRA